MKTGLIIFGIILLIGTYYLVEVMITPQQKAQLRTVESLCNLNAWGIPIGQLGQAISSEAAEKCDEAAKAKQIVSLAPFGYGAGFLMLVLGLALGGSKREIVRVVEKRVRNDDDEDTPKSKDKGKFCGNCGVKLKMGDKFCGSCGEKV